MRCKGAKVKQEIPKGLFFGIAAILAIVAIGAVVLFVFGGGGGIPDTERLNPEETAAQMQAPPSGSTEAPAERMRTESNMPAPGAAQPGGY